MRTATEAGVRRYQITPAPRNKSRRLSVDIVEEDWERLYLICQELDMNISDAVRCLIREGMGLMREDR